MSISTPVITHYTMLRVSPQADADEIKRAYRKACRENHPDITGVENSDLLAALHEAYRVLSHEDLKVSYDQSLTSSAHSFDEPSSPAQDDQPWGQESTWDVPRSHDRENAFRTQPNVDITVEPVVAQKMGAKSNGIWNYLIIKARFIFLILALACYTFPPAAVAYVDEFSRSALGISLVLYTMGIIAHFLMLSSRVKGYDGNSTKFILFIVFSAVLVVGWTGFSTGLGTVLFLQTVFTLSYVSGARRKNIQKFHENASS